MKAAYSSTAVAAAEAWSYREALELELVDQAAERERGGGLAF